MSFLKFYKLAEIRAFLLKISFRTGTSGKRTQISSGYTTNGPKSKKTVAKSLTTDFQILQPKNAITENNRKKITENIKSVEELYRLWILAMLQPKRFSKNSLNRERPNLFFALWPILMAHNLRHFVALNEHYWTLLNSRGTFQPELGKSYNLNWSQSFFIKCLKFWQSSKMIFLWNDQ